MVGFKLFVLLKESFADDEILIIKGSGQNYHTGSGPTFRRGVRGRCHGSLMVGGGIRKDTMGL